MGLALVVALGCAPPTEPLNPAALLGQPLVDFVLGGYWEITLDPNSVAMNVDRLGRPLDQMVARAIEAGVASLCKPRSERLLLLEVAEGRFSYLHDYDLVAGTGIRTQIGDAFPPPPPPSTQPSDGGGGVPAGPNLSDSWPDRALWIENDADAGLRLAVQEPPQITEFGEELSVVVRLITRLSGATPTSMRFDVVFDLHLVAERDYPIIPVFRVLDLQRGESLPAKLALTFVVRRLPSPGEMGLPPATDVQGGGEVILPLADLVRAALFDENPEP